MERRLERLLLAGIRSEHVLSCDQDQEKSKFQPTGHQAPLRVGTPTCTSFTRAGAALRPWGLALSHSRGPPQLWGAMGGKWSRPPPWPCAPPPCAPRHDLAQLGRPIAHLAPPPSRSPRWPPFPRAHTVDGHREPADPSGGPGRGGGGLGPGSRGCRAMAGF